MRKIGGIALILFAVLLLSEVIVYSLPEAIKAFNDSNLPGGRTKGYAMGRLLAQSFKIGIVILLAFLGVRMIRRR